MLYISNQQGKVITTFLFFFFSFSIYSQELINENIDSVFSVESFNDIDTNNYSDFDIFAIQENFNAFKKQTTFPYFINNEIINNIEYFLNHKKKNLYVLHCLSNYYFPIFEKFLDKYNMPLELKYLPLIESSLIPYIKSHMGATGLWQFMYETGKEYGLKTNTIYDERCDANKSTEAACTYLRSLYERYDNWLLALSAYNCGPGNVNKAIQRAGTKNYFQVAQYLPEETQLYVPKFITYSYIFNYSGKLNVPCFSDDFFYTDTIIVKEDISLQFISDMIKVEYSQLRYYNSVYTSGIVPEGYPVYIPSTKISEYLRIFEKREGVEQDGIKTEIPELIEPEQTPQSQEQEQTNPDENMFNTIKPE